VFRSLFRRFLKPGKLLLLFLPPTVKCGDCPLEPAVRHARLLTNWREMNVYREQVGTCLPMLFFCVVAVFTPRAVFSAQKEPGEGTPVIRQPAGEEKNLGESEDPFVKEAIAKFGDHRAASQALALEGWNLLRESKVALALRRFNAARLLDPKNYQAHWGYGAVLSDQGKLSEAIQELETAGELIGDSEERVFLLADMGALYSQYAAHLPKAAELERARAFVTANQRFTESLEIDRDYARGWRDWAISLYQQERFSEAWIKAQRAIELKAEPFPKNFLDRLRKRLSNEP